MVISYKWLSEFFDEPLPPAQEVADLLSIHSFEIEGVEAAGEDTLIDIDVLPNRAHDCLSHRGIARELGAILGRDLYKDPLRDQFLKLPEGGVIASVDEDLEGVSTMTVLVKGIRIAESPSRLKERLEVLGQRSINNVVDITNYVMLAMGQPLHAFDAKVFSEGVLRVKRAEEGEELKLLGDIDVVLDTNDAVISDGTRALDAGGIRGGFDAEIGKDTVDIVLSASHFDPTMVRKTAQRLKLWTDAAKRFQNDPSPYLVEHGMRECLEMVLDLAGGEVVGMSRAGAVLPQSKEVEVSIDRINGLLGLSLSYDEVIDILKRIGASYSGTDVIMVTPPIERLDLNIEEDVIEEIGRLHGYDKLPHMPLPERKDTPVSKRFIASEIIRDVLLGEGYSEVFTYSLQQTGKLKLQNALNVEKNHLRVDLKSGLEEALELNKANMPLLGREHIDIFEIGHVFPTDERVYLGIATTRKKKLFDELVSLLSEKLGVAVEGSISGNVFEADITDLFEKVEDASLPPYTPQFMKFAIPSAYPFVLRDVAVWTPEGTQEEVIKELIVSKAGDLLVRIDCFDTYTKEGRTSFAFHLVFQSAEKTLSDEEVNGYMDGVYGVLEEQEGFEIR